MIHQASLFPNLSIVSQSIVDLPNTILDITELVTMQHVAHSQRIHMHALLDIFCKY